MGKDVEGSCHGLVKVLSQVLMENMDQDCQRPAKIQIQACSEYKSIALLLHKSVNPCMKLVLAARQK
jgi:hypothetical protein